MGVHVADAVAKEEVFNKDQKIINSISGDFKVSSSKLTDPRALDGMTPVQEYCNAISMPIPGLVCLYLYNYQPHENWWNWRMSWMTISLILHLPFSCSYHLLLAKRMLKDAVDNSARRLDQSFIHLTCLITAIALSEDDVYAAVCVILNMYFISRLWAKNDAGLMERMGNIGLGVLLYALPPLLRGDYVNVVCGGFWFLLGAVMMYLRFGGWGHCLLHVLSGGLCYHAMLATTVISSP